MEGKVEYWLELAQYDLDTAKVMLDGKRYLYVGFMCHQVVEKALKGYYVLNIKDTPPHIHNLSMLAKKVKLYDVFSEEQKDLIDLLEPLNIEARYPTVKEKLMQSLSDQKCKQLIEKTEALYLWIKAKSLK